MMTIALVLQIFRQTFLCTGKILYSLFNQCHENAHTSLKRAYY